MKEIFDFAKLVKRKVEQRQLEGRPAYAIVLESTYDVDANELWDALTNKDRLSLWFLPVSGELRTGGNYQLEGNAKGSINRCDQPKGFDITWEFGDNVSWVKVDLTAVTESQTTLRLEHLAIAEGEHWENYDLELWALVGIWELGASVTTYGLIKLLIRRLFLHVLSTESLYHFLLKIGVRLHVMRGMIEKNLLQSPKEPKNSTWENSLTK
ncbi:MAG: SRPBCC domain-containing protein [candidate division Zixibacteria bacterium]|nr:SRPBCC domain-containing protein [candidate division Zixibacteria bacterium]